MMEKRKRVLVKFSGEALAGNNGFGIDKNYNLALSCLDESVKEGDDLAINIIVKMAKNSFYEAQEYLGLMYYEGYGVEEDIEEAFHWFKSAAKQRT